MLSYKEESLEAAVKFLAANNQFFLGREDYIRASIISLICELGRSKGSSLATMGVRVEITDVFIENYPNVRIFIDLDVLHRDFTLARLEV